LRYGTISEVSERAGQADSPAGQVGEIRVRYWASARAAAGVAEDVLEVTGPTTLESLRSRAKQLRTSSRFADVLDTCSVLIGDLPVASEDPASVVVRPGQTVEFLPPFAGG
jgi:molybdopterin synthase sulfur carrier subunit